MTSQEKKAYLERYKEANQEIDRLCEELSRWRALATKITPVLSQEPAGGHEGENQIELAVKKIIALEGQINAKIDDLLKIKQQVEKAIQTVQDGTLREVLIQRYILGKKWEQIADGMNYDYRWVLRLYGKALTQIKITETIKSHYKPVI